MSYVVLCYTLSRLFFSILNLHKLVQYFINHYMFSSIKETSWLISKGMCVLLFDVFNGCYLIKK